MNNLMSNFSDLALSRKEMKKVLGGKADVTCDTTYTFSNGSTMKTSGGCSSNSQSQCTTYASNAANSLMAQDPDITRASVQCYT
jgi:natural product precursor